MLGRIDRIENYSAESGRRLLTGPQRRRISHKLNHQMRTARRQPGLWPEVTVRYGTKPAGPGKIAATEAAAVNARLTGLARTQFQVRGGKIRSWLGVPANQMRRTTNKRGDR